MTSFSVKISDLKKDYKPKRVVVYDKKDNIVYECVCKSFDEGLSVLSKYDPTDRQNKHIDRIVFTLV